MTTVRRTRRWKGMVALALSAAAIGALAKISLVMLLAVVGVVFATYPRLTTPPTLDSDLDLDLDREFAAAEPTPGDDVDVTVAVHNRGDDILPDLRIVDGIPPMLSVTDGSARHMATLRPGQTTRFSYTLAAERGTHHYEPATVLASDLAGTYEVETTLAATDGGQLIECLADVPIVPLRRQTGQFAGNIPTADGGQGIEFHHTRAYHPGDALARIDWHRYARTGRLSTIQFREERAAVVVLCLDAREPCYRAPTPEDHNAVAYGRMAVEQLLTALAGTTDTVGLTALSDRERCWLAPAAGQDHVDRARGLLTSHPALSAAPPTEAAPDRWDEHLTAIGRQLAAETQVLLLSPLADDFAVEAALTLEAAGHAVTVISPDVTTDATVGGAFGRTERHNRLHTLREAGVRVVDWPTGEALGAVLVKVQNGWSA